MAVYEYKTHIKYSDISENNELSDKGLLNILSEAAGVHSAAVGYGLNDIEQTKVSWMLLFWKLKFFKRPRWNTELTVKTWPRKFEKVSSWRDFEVFDEQGKQVAIASTEWVLIDNVKQSIGRVTEELANRYGIVEKDAFEEKFEGKIKEPENKVKVYEYTAKRRDIDVNHHVNNGVYLELAYDALPESADVNFDNLEIQYKKQIKLGDTVALFYSKEDNVHTVCIKSQDEKTLHAILKFY